MDTGTVNLRELAGRRLAALVVMAIAMLVHVLTEHGEKTPLRSLVFDGYQSLMPRFTEQFPVRVIDVDEESLRLHGQWPWPRYMMARMVEKAAGLGALAVGIDVIMSESDRNDPAAVVAGHPGIDPGLLQQLEALETNDERLARVLAATPSVVARVGRPARDDLSAGRVVRSAPVSTQGKDPLPHMIAYDGLTLNVDEIEKGARGHGMVNAVFDADGVVRRAPVVSRVEDRILPSLALEMLRIATGTPFLQVRGGEDGVEGVKMGTAYFPVDPDGGLTLHFAHSHPARRISAARLLADELEPGSLSGQLALIGVTALGTADSPPTPIIGRMDGVEIQAQLVEALISGARLERPGFAELVESLALALAALVLIGALPALGPRRGSILAGLVLLALAGGGLLAFHHQRWLLDPSIPMIGAAAVFATLLASLLVAERRRAQELDAQLEQERVASARLAGELDAARNIQMGILPDPTRVLGMPDSVTVAASLEPARSVGGDLYDLFMVDERRLFFTVGDVSGKGIPASLFMALSKSLCKSVVMRADGTVADRITIANAEIARENPEMLFVTVIAGLLDTESGSLDLCNAGHDSPWLLRAGEAPRELDTLGGPPLCVMEDFEYPTEHFKLEPGDTLVLSTDGVTEAMDPAQTLYGKERLETLLVSLPDDASAAQVVQAVADDVTRFADGAEPNDDITVMVLEFRGAREMAA